jgi:hypothetical protein
MTNAQLINAALRMLGVLDANESASAEDGVVGLEELNDMMASLTADGIDFGFPTQDNLQDEFPLDDTTLSLVKPILAVRLQVYYPSNAAPPTLLASAADSKRKLMRDAVLGNMEEADLRNVPLGEGYRRSVSILTDD